MLRAIHAALPNERLIYVADSAHAPYGERSASYITERCEHITRGLLAHQVKAIVVACNTATLVAVQALRSTTDAPIIAIEPAIKPAVVATRNKVVGVLATTQTVHSTGVARLVAEYGAGVNIHLQACPGLVEAVERGELRANDTRALLASYVQPLIAAGTDTLVLGCTHYPFLLPLLRELVGDAVTIIDPAAAVARELVRRLSEAQNLNALASASAGNIQFYSTDSPRVASSVMGALWGSPLVVQAWQ